MKVYSQLEKAQLENVTSDVANEPKGMVKYRTDIDQAKVSNGTTYKTLIDEDSTQSLSNKTLISPEVNGAITFDQIATPATPAAGENKFYFKNDNKAYYLDSAGTERAVGSGSGGEINFLQLSDVSWDAEAGTIGWNLYQDAAASRPVDGTGGTPAVTVSTLAFNALSGDRSIILTKPNSNVQGQGWSIDFSIDRANQARVLKVEFDYNVAAGTFVAGTTSADSDIIVYLYDVTNNRLIEPSTFKLFSNSTTVADKFSGYFQTSADSLNYRLIFHVTTTSAVAFDLRVDNIIVTPSKYVFGTPITDWVSYTPTITSGAGSILATIEGRWRRVGDSAEIRIDYVYTSGTGAAANLAISLPTGQSIDNSKRTSFQTLGSGYFFRTSTGFLGTEIRRSTDTSVQFSLNGANGFILGTDADDAGAGISVAFQVPIQGWSSSVKVSDGFETRQVSFQASRNGVDQTGVNPNNSAVKVLFNSVSGSTDTDPTASYNTANSRFVAPTSGRYFFNVKFVVAGTNVLGNTYVPLLYKNGVEVTRGSLIAATAGIQFAADLLAYDNAVAGDFYEVFLLGIGNNSVNTLTIVGTSSRSNFSGHLLQSPQTTAQGEVVAAKYVTSAGQAIAATSTIVNYETKVEDTHNAVTTGANWGFRTPSSGLYDVEVGFLFASVSYSVSQNAYMELFVDGIFVDRIALDRADTTTSVFLGGYGSTKVRLNAGQVISIRGINERGPTSLVAVAQRYNFICITKVG